MLSVGLTGNIASGKSSVAQLLVEHHGLPVIDADQVARLVVEPGQPAHSAIAQRFGAGVLRPDGQLDREALGRIIRRDPQDRQDLEAITHPAIYAHIDAWLSARELQGATMAFVEAALLVETGQQRRYDRLLVVSCSPTLQVQRLVQRDGLTQADAQAWLATQLPAARKEQVADLVIRNDGDLALLEAEVTRAVTWLRRESERARRPPPRR